MVTVRILENHGYRVTMAEDGEAALKALEAKTPDLMVLDVQMPEMDGIEMIARMKEFVPFLIQTFLPDDDPRVWGSSRGGTTTWFIPRFPAVESTRTWQPGHWYFLFRVRYQERRNCLDTGS